MKKSKMAKKKMGRPKTDEENAEVSSIRLTPTQKLMIIKRFGSLQKWINKMVSKDETFTRGDK